MKVSGAPRWGRYLTDGEACAFFSLLPLDVFNAYTPCHAIISTHNISLVAMLANSRISTRVTAKPVASVRRSSRAVVCSAQAQSSASGVESRRSAIALFGGVAGAIFADAPAFAAYGEKANVFGSKTENTGTSLLSIFL